MLMRAGDQSRPQTSAKWQSFSIRSVLGDTLHDDDDDDDYSEEDLDVVVDAGVHPDCVDQATTPLGEEFCPTDLSPGTGDSEESGGGGDVTSGRVGQQQDVNDDATQRTVNSSSLHCADELHDFNRWTAFHTAPNVIISSSQHPAALNNRYSNHGLYTAILSILYMPLYVTWEVPSELQGRAPTPTWCGSTVADSGTILHAACNFWTIIYCDY